MADYAKDNVLVGTDWVAEHLNDPKVRLVEVDVDTASYEQGHIPGAMGWNWKTQLQDNVRRDLISKAAMEDLLSNSGIGNDTTVVLYGDNNNWFAAWAYWQLKYYGHRDVRMMNGGRAKWLAENRPLTSEVASHPHTAYKAQQANESIRAYRDQVQQQVRARRGVLVDVRSPEEYRGEILAPPHLPQEASQRPGHIPGAMNIPWSKAVNEDGTFKSADDLRRLYEGAGVTPDKEVIAYCRIGERSSHTWFVLNELLGYKNARNYDGSWTEWGSSVGVPIEKAA